MSPERGGAAAEIQPVVLVGGRSRRFGRDKLCEPTAGRLLVERPIAALRAVFGARVKVVGDCDARIGALADGVIHDAYPGMGPIGGIVSALRACGGTVFVLAGDMPAFSAEHVERVVTAAARDTEAWAVLARTESLQPCAGIYRVGALDLLSARLAGGDRSLMEAIPRERRTEVLIEDAGACVNVNTPEDFRRWTG